MSIGSFRNKKCYCGSGLKFKKCHLYIDQPKNMFDLQEKIVKFLSKKEDKSKPQETPKGSTSVDSPPDLGIEVNEQVKATPVFGRR